MEQNAIDAKFEMYVDSADFYSAAKHWKEAEAMTIKALKIKPANKANWLLWANLAEIRKNLNDLEGAMEAYDIGLSMQPASAVMLSGRAELLIREGRNTEAIEDLDTLLKNDPTSENALTMRGWLFFDSGRLEEAEKDFASLKSSCPDHPQGYDGLAAIKSREGKPLEAIGLYAESLRIVPDEDNYFYMVSLQADCGNLQEAADSLREGMKEYPRSGKLYLLRAYLHKLNFQNEEAQIALKLAKEYGADLRLIQQIFPGK
ncbi:MAG: tetratricopeptide repeat protein [Muribaculaceae bacterium]|nr:tetratricopeptide repeat protein [Muribaculaceae bacterium]